jgi:hypothetical protein
LKASIASHFAKISASLEAASKFFSIGIGRILHLSFAITYRGFEPRKSPQMARSILVDKWINDSEL